MASVIRSRAVSPELWWFQFSNDVDISSAYDTSKYTFEGADQTLLLPLQVFFGDTADSVLVKTSPGTEQDYTITISGLLDLSGSIIEDIIWALMPKVLPAYPPVGIIDLLTDGEGWGSTLRAQTEHHESLSGISGFVDETAYPFTQSVDNPSIYEFDTSQLEEPVDEFAIRPLVAPGHEGEFTEDQTADLVVSLLIARLPPELDNLRLLNPEREWDDTVTIIDGIITVGDMKPWRNYRGAELMIARLGDPEDLIPVLPYYPPGANDPNDPNYDPEAPEDGSANPPWWIGPVLPDKLPFFPWDRVKPPAIDLFDPGDCDPGFREPPIGPPELLVPPVQVQFPQIDISEHDLPAGDHTVIARIYNESNDYNEYSLPFRIDVPVDVPYLGAIGQVERNLGIIEGNEPGTYGIDQPFGTVTGGKVTLHNRSGQSFSGMLHIPTNGGQNDVPLTEDPPGSDTHKADVSDQELPSIDSTLEYTLGAAAPVTVNFPLFETWDEAHVDGFKITDSDGQVPAEIDPVKRYHVEGTLNVSGGMSKYRLKGKYSGAIGRTGETVIGERLTVPGSIFERFVFHLEGSEIIKATGGSSGIDERWLAIEAENFLGHWVEAGETLSIPDGAWSDDLQEVIIEGVQAYIDSEAVYGDGGKLPPEEIDSTSTNPRIKGVDCSGFVFNILDRALKKLKPETGGLEELWRHNSPERKARYPNINNPYERGCWGIGLGTDPNLWNYVDDDTKDNPEIGELQPGDILHYNRGDYAGEDGHYEIVEKIEENPDGTKNVTIAHSNGSQGPHRYCIENVSDDDKLKDISEDQYKDEQGNQAPHNEYVTLQKMKHVKRLKELDEREEHE